MPETRNDELYRALKHNGYPDDFCREIAYRQMNTDFTATRMLGYLYRVTSPRAEDVVDEMLRVPDAALDALSATGYDPVYGARPLRRAIQSTIADQAAGMLLDGSLRRGDVVTAQVREGKIVLTKTCERGMITP